MFYAIQTHSGQYRKYGDSVDEWKIETDIEDTKRMLAACRRELLHREVPTYTEWVKKAPEQDPQYYFDGFCQLTQHPDGFWIFQHRKPYRG